MNTAGFRFNAATTVDLNSNVAKIDWNINDKQSVFFRANAIYDFPARRRNFRIHLSRAPGRTRGDSWPATPGPRVRTSVNNFRYGFTRQGSTQVGDSTDNQISFRFIF